jgi:hypothetical protein
MSSPPLTGRPPAQASGSFETGSSRPQALIQHRQRLIIVDELRLSELVNLSWSAPQPAAGDLAVAQPVTVFLNGLDRGAELTGDSSPRHMLISLLLYARTSRAEHVEGARQRWRLSRPSGAGSLQTLETGSESPLGPNCVWIGTHE